MKQEKELLLNEIKDQISRSKSLIVAQYGALPPDKVWGLRSSLAKNGNSLEVVRKRIFLQAAIKSGIQLDKSLIKGNVGVVFISQDEPMTALKEVFKFKKENPDTKLGVLCGYIEGKIATAADVEYLSKLPSLDEMRSQFLALLVAPMSHTLSVFEEKIKLSSGTDEQTN